MNFTGFLNVLFQALGADIAVDGDGDVWPKLAILNQPVFDPRKARLKLLNNFSHRVAGRRHLVRSAGEAL
jgi:hypothetical protein